MDAALPRSDPEMIVRMSDSPRPGREPADGDVKDALVSYSRSDLSYVDTLTQHLVDAGFSLWIDRRDILPSA